MGLDSFLSQLFENGRVAVPVVEELGDEALEAARVQLEAFEQEYRSSLAGSPPAFSARAGLWGATALYRGCQLLVFPDYDANQLREVFSTAFPEDFTASAHYSVDLTMRFLPDLFQLAQTRSSDNLLVDELNKLAHQWPLSSVGIGDVVDVFIRPIVEDSCLLQLYVDRIIAREDVGRLTNPSVRLTARRAIGIHRHLAPKIADAIDVLEQEKTVP